MNATLRWVAPLALLAGCAGPSTEPKLTEFQYHVWVGCRAILTEYVGEIERAEALHRLGCDDISPEINALALAEATQVMDKVIDKP